MSIESFTAQLNGHYFLREFAFPSANFRVSGTELELADGIVWLDDLRLVIQVKEREPNASTDSDALDRWFEKKVQGSAAKQIRDTLKYLQQNSSITVKNLRGQDVDIVYLPQVPLVKVIIYSEGQANVVTKRPKFHISRTAGFIHYLALEDYRLLLRTLLTPVEILEYFNWREHLLLGVWNETVESLSERAIIGHYLHGFMDRVPGESDGLYADLLQEDVESWDVTGILHRFLDRTYSGVEGNNYHRIIAEIAKLNRAELGEFKKRFAFCMKKAGRGKFQMPTRVTCPRTGCSFVFIPMTEDLFSSRLIGLKNLTILNKYEQRVEKCIGLGFVKHPDNQQPPIVVDWLLSVNPWSHNDEIESMLRDNSPFLPTKTRRVERYEFMARTVGS